MTCAGCHCSVPVSCPPQQSGRSFADMWSSPSTSEDESAGSIAGDFSAPLLQRSTGRQLLRSSTASSSSPTHSRHHRHRRTGSQHMTGSFQEAGSSDLVPDMTRQSVQSVRPPLPQKQGLSGGGEAVVCGAECDVEVIGLVLLHPSVAGEVGPSFTRLLGRSRSDPSALQCTCCTVYSPLSPS